MQGAKLSTFGKAKTVSTLQARHTLRELTRGLPSRDDTQSLARHGVRWLNAAAAGVMPIAATLAMVWLATMGLVVIHYFLPLNLVSLVYLLPVVIAATQWGIGSGVVAAIAGAAAADFFFYPPLYTLWINDPQDVVDLILFLLVALITSNLAARLKKEAQVLRRREKQIGELHAFSQGLATCLTSRDLIFAVQDYLSNTLGYRAVLIATAPDDANNSGPAAIPEKIRREAVRLIAAGAPRCGRCCSQGTSRPRHSPGVPARQRASP